MFLTQTNVIRGLDKKQYAMLREMCQYSNNLYNFALYNIRQYFFKSRTFLKRSRYDNPGVNYAPTLVGV